MPALRRPWPSISLGIAAPLLVLAGYFLVRAGTALPLVQDDAGLMSATQRETLARYHDYFRRDHDIDYRVVTARDLADLNGTALELIEAVADARRSTTGRSLVLLIDAEADLVRLEVGYILEGVFPDAFVAYVEHRQMVPFFERGRVADGILATTELLVTRAQNAAANAGFETEVWYGGGGAGATAPARIGAGPTELPPASQAAVTAGRPPAETLDAYLAVMAARNADPDLPIYTPDSRHMLRDWVMTAAQMDNVARSYRRCTAQEPLISPDGRHAVIRYPPGSRECAPFFLAFVDGAWALDLATMQQVIRFGRSNAWRLVERSGHPYAFAFADWTFDRNGFPVDDH